MMMLTDTNTKHRLLQGGPINNNNIIILNRLRKIGMCPNPNCIINNNTQPFQPTTTTATRTTKTTIKRRIIVLCAMIFHHLMNSSFMVTGGTGMTRLLIAIVCPAVTTTTVSAYQLKNKGNNNKGMGYDPKRRTSSSSSSSSSLGVDHRSFSFPSSKREQQQQKQHSAGQVGMSGIGGVGGGSSISTSGDTSSTTSNTKRSYKNDRLGEVDVALTDHTDRGGAGGKHHDYHHHHHHQRKGGWSFGLLESIIKENRKHYLVSKTKVHTVEDLRHAILDQQLSLSDTEIIQPILQSNGQQITASTTTNSTTGGAVSSARGPSTDMFKNHAVRTIMEQRYRSGSTPGNRQDGAKLALAIEGGGMRGCVSAGMAAAITALGLTDTIDVMYGSSAGSVVGAYLISRQVCMDVYVDILPAAKRLFVCKKRMVKSLASSLGQVLFSGMRRSSEFKNQLRHDPGMNISFVLDGIMGQDHGIRPLDMEKFEQNDARQPLRVVSSAIDPQTGRLFSRCFGTDEFFNNTAVEKVTLVGESPSQARRGLFACLEASMTVPGATGPPVNIRQPHRKDDLLPCFDAFCFEPIPYRSAVEEGATHVLVLCSRPEDYKLKTKPGIYETGVAPLYFHSHGHSSVAEYFEQGGQQYVYAEDILTLEDAARKKITISTDDDDVVDWTKQDEHMVLVPPPRILYGVTPDQETIDCIRNREKEWKRAHLMPIRVPMGQKELPTLEQDKDAVLEAVRGGFSAAFDSLSGIVGLDHMEGSKVAKLVFPNDDDENLVVVDNDDDFRGNSATASIEEIILGTKLQVPGEPIPERGIVVNTRPYSTFDFGLRGGSNATGTIDGHQHHHTTMNTNNDLSRTLLMTLPGFQEGRYGHLAKGLVESAMSRASQNS